MRAYRTYMDRQQGSDALRETLLDLETPEKGANHWKKWGAVAACAALLVGVGAFAWNSLGLPQGGEPIAPPRPGESATAEIPPAETPDASSGIFVPIDPVEGSEAPTEAAEPTPALDADPVEPVNDNSFLVAGDGASNATNGFMIPAFHYPDLTNAPEVDAAIVLPQGSYTVALAQGDVTGILWGDNGWKEEVPWMLGWEGCTVSGSALYDGNGDLRQVTLTGEHDSERFTIRLSPGALPITDVVAEDAAVKRFRDVEVETWHKYYDSDGDGEKEYHVECAFLAHGVGVRASFVSPEEDAAFLGSNLFINWCTYSDGGLTLDHILKNDDIPAWAEVTLTSLSQAREYADFAPYLPTAAPAGFEGSEFDGHYRYQEDRYNDLWVRWYRGYDYVEVEVRRPEGTASDSCVPVDVDSPETYDWRLYDGPVCDMPEEIQPYFLYPATFRAQDMSLEVVRARETAHDTGGSRYSFNILFADGTVAQYTCCGMTAEQVWALVQPTLG